MRETFADGSGLCGSLSDDMVVAVNDGIGGRCADMMQSNSCAACSEDYMGGGYVQQAHKAASRSWYTPLCCRGQHSSR